MTALMDYNVSLYRLIFFRKSIRTVAMKDNSQTGLKTPLIVMALLSVIAVTITIVYLTFGRSSDEPTFTFARSMDDATVDCENKIIDQYDDDIISKYFDQFSSRYDADRRQYIIYYRVHVKEIKDDLPVVNEYMAKCIVWERLGYVSDFSIFKDF